jgi:signal transduction histidine kinase
VGLASLAGVLLLAAFIGYFADARRRAEALRLSQAYAERLAQLHEKTQKILDHVPSGVLALSAAGEVTSLNQALRDRCPWASEGSSLAELFRQAPQAVVLRLESLVTAAAQSGKSVTLSGEALALFGEEGRYQIHAVPLERRDPEVQVLLVLEDLSNVHALESQLLRAEKLATVGVLAAGIAHEIGTPLGVVRGRAEYTIEKLGREHALARGLSVIVDQTDRVTRTIRQLLDFSRVQPGALRPVPLAPLLSEIQELLSLEAERRKVRLTLHPPSGPASLLADRDQLQQVLVNLLLNAFDACSPGGSVEVKSEIEAGQGWRRMKLTLIDDGRGIPEAYLHQVFDPFFTTKKRGQGTGLGLAVVAQLVRSHGGEVELESDEGKGTRVTVRWPLTAAEGEPIHAAS